MSVTWGNGGDSLVDMKMILLAVAVYSVGVGLATFASNAMDNSPTIDTIAGLPSTGSLLHSTGTTAAALDIGTGALIWWWAMRG